MKTSVEKMLIEAKKGLAPEHYDELCHKLSSIILDYAFLIGHRDMANYSLNQVKILVQNKNVQNAIKRGWKLLTPLKGHDAIVLAAPKGFKVRQYGLTGTGDYVWGNVDENGCFTYKDYDCRSRYNARAYYEKQAKQLNGFKGEGCSYVGNF